MKSDERRVSGNMVNASKRRINVYALLVGLCLAGPVAAATMPILFPYTPLVDPANQLSVAAKANIEGSIAKFRALSGRWMVVIVLPRGRVPEFSKAERQNLDPAIGIIYVTSPDDAAGRLLIVDPVWQKASPNQWTYLFPQRLAQKYGDEAFERRVVLSADYLARVFSDKIAFVLKPRGGKLSPESLRFSRGAYIGIEILGYFIIFFTAFRTFWPARLRDEDQDAFSNEIRRLKKERQIW